jgi:hypothetical protein
MSWYDNATDQEIVDRFAEVTLLRTQPVKSMPGFRTEIEKLAPRVYELLLNALYDAERRRQGRP